MSKENKKRIKELEEKLKLYESNSELKDLIDSTEKAKKNFKKLEEENKEYQKQYRKLLKEVWSLYVEMKKSYEKENDTVYTPKYLDGFDINNVLNELPKE